MKKSKYAAKVIVDGLEVEIKSDDSLLVKDVAREVSSILIRRKILVQRGVYRSLTANLVRLRYSGFFSKERTLNEIREKLNERGFSVPNTTLSPVLSKLTDRGLFVLSERGRELTYTVTH